MALCDKCKNYSKSYDEFQHSYDDQIIVGEKRVAHFCRMYTDHIPYDITYNEGDCQFYIPKDEKDVKR